MDFKERSYGGKIFRPRPEIYFNDSNQLIIVATPWGPRQTASQSIHTFLDYFLSASEDTDVTSPFERLPYLSPVANNLRISALYTNSFLYRNENKQEYFTGIEIFAVHIGQNEVDWLQIGSPNSFLSRKGFCPQPLGSQLDSSFDLKKDLPPLPNRLLGIDPTCYPIVNSFRKHSTDQIFLVSRNHFPSSFFSQRNHPLNLDNLSHTLAQDNPDMPFWVGIINL